MELNLEVGGAAGKEILESETLGTADRISYDMSTICCRS
jgi:hypothetical protein